MNATPFKAIKISADNASKINALLDEVNGKATAHTYTDASEIIALAEVAEKKVVKLVGSQKDAVGAKAVAESGGPVANSYRNSRIGTQVVIERRPTGWFIVDARSVNLYSDGGHKMKLAFTAEQDAKAVAVLRMQYSYPATEAVAA